MDTLNRPGVSPAESGGMPPAREKNPQLEAALANKLIGGGEGLPDELIRFGEAPQEVFYGLRQIEKKLESALIPFSLAEGYKPPMQLSVLINRAEALKLSNEELIKKGWLINYNSVTGEGLPAHRKYSSLALSIDENFVTNEKGETASNIFGLPETRFVFKYGTNGTNQEGETRNTRAELARAYEQAALEIEARAIMGEHIGVRLDKDYRDSLENLTAVMHSGRIPKFKAEHLSALFNMPGVEELEKNPNNHVLGDQVEEAMFLNLVMLNSGTKQKMIDFLERPGAKHLIAKLAKEQGEREKKEITYDEWVERNIGKYKDWENDEKREFGTFLAEASDGRRGPLTKWSNISALYDPKREFGADNEHEFIETTVGGLVGSVEASWVAATFMRVAGVYASEGYVTLPNGKSHLPLGESRYISGDDTGKFWVYMFCMKEGLKGRPSGLKDMIGRVPDMAMSLLDWMQVRVGRNPDRTEIRRSVIDAWLGTAGGKVRHNLLTGEPTAQRTVEEQYNRLGDLDFKSLPREFHDSYTIMQWLMGNREGPTGIYIDIMKVDKIGFDDFSLQELKKKTKYFDICLNDVVLTQGSPHRYVLIEGVAKKIGRNLLRNLSAARIQSIAFAQNVLSQKVPLFNPDLGERIQNASAACIVELNIIEALKNWPEDETSLKSHYVDSNFLLRTKTLFDNPVRIEAVVTKAGASFEDYVGKVTGKVKR